MELSKQELERYNRHIILSEIGIDGQKKLKEAKVLVIGAGGLGCPILQYLTAAGVGTIGIIDSDVVDESNLQRQILFSTLDVGKPKAEVAKNKLKALNPFCNITSYNERFIKENASKIVSEYDLIIDCPDNFETRYLTNDVCLYQNKTWVYGAISEFEGQVAVFNYKGSSTYRDLFPENKKSENKQKLGVIGTLPAIIGSLQANEAIKIILEKGDILANKLLIFNTMNLNFMLLNI